MKVDINKLKEGEGMIIHMITPSDEILLARSEDGLVVFPIIKPQEDLQRHGT